MGEPEKTGAESGSSEIPAPEAQQIKDEFSRRWYRQLGISGQVLLIMFPVLVWADNGGDPSMPLVALAGISLLVGIGGSLWNWRCPHCSTYFGKQFFGLKFCRSCGVELV